MLEFSLFAVLFILILIGVVNNFLYLSYLRKLLNFLKEKYPESWKALGEPSIFKLSFSPKKVLRIFRYINNEEYKNVGDETLNLIGSRVKKFFRFGIVWVSLLTLLIMAATVMVSLAPIFFSTQNEAIIANTIEVYVDENPKDPNNLNKINIGIITVGTDGQLLLNVDKEIPLVSDILRSAVAEIQARKSLKLALESPEEMNGRLVQVLRHVDVPPEDPRYIYAVTDVLQLEFGLEARVR